MKAYEEAMNALGDPTRRAIFEQLAKGAKPVGELAKVMPVSRPAVSQHLRVLKMAGLVSERPLGTRRVYRIDPDGVVALRAYFERFWDQALADFQAAAEAEEGAGMSTTEALAAIEKTITVNASLETAFETFTRRMGDWWPGEPHTVFENRAAVIFDERVGGRVYERADDGREADWADVIAWEPPERFVLRWRVNPKRGPTEIEVRFTAENGRTRVDLEHRGWDEVGDAEGRANYDGGWDKVLGGYVASFSR